MSAIYIGSSEVFSTQVSHKELDLIKAKYHLPKSFALYVGDVTPNKNLPRIISSIGESEYSLVLVGKALVSEHFDKQNPWNKDLVTVKKMTQQYENVKLLGFVPDEDLPAIYKLSTALVMPSLYEGFGLPVLEAMLCGTPVITSDRGSLREVAGEAAYYVDPESVESIKAGIRKIFVDDTLRESLIAKGKIQSKKFSWKEAAEETANIYQQVMGDER